MKRVSVQPDDGRWRVGVDYGEKGFNEWFKTKFFAVLYARQKGREMGTPEEPVSVVVHKKNGQYQTEWTYPRSADPQESRG